MKILFNFNLSTWMRNVEVEADSYDEALEELYKMTIAQMLENGMEDDTSISDIDGEYLEKTIKARVYDIEYEIEEDDFDDPEDYLKVINSLPEEMTVDVLILVDSYSEEDAIADEITYRTDYLVKDFKYTIIEEY